MSEGWSDARALAVRGLARVRTANGVSFAIGGDGPLLVLLHGGSGAWNHWLDNLAPLAERFRVAAPDLPGFGLSEPVDPEIPNDAYVALTAAALAEIAASAPIHLSGFSFGGFLAARLAHAMTPQVARLSLIGPNGFPPPKDRAVALYGPKTLEKRLGRAPNEAELREMHRNNLSEMMLSAPAAIDSPLVDMHAWNVARTRYNSRRLSWSGEMPALFPTLAMPIQLLYGAHDRSQAPTIEARMLELQAMRPDTSLHRVEGAGHWAMHEASAEVNNRLAAFHGA